jgi:Flp pilus assembly protein protease CpaA
MYEVIFLWILSLVYIISAVIQDIKTKEIANWISFSLMIFALGFRFFYSLFQGDGFVFFYNGLIGLAIFFVIGNLLYYGKVFAGGDAKLMISLGTILPYSSNIFSNIQGFFNFILIFLFVGFLYIFVSSTFFCMRNFKSFKKEFLKQLKKNKRLMIITISISALLLLFGFVQRLSFILGVLIFLTSYLYLYSKAIDESCMIKRIKTSDLRDGDWLYSNLKIGKKVISAKWEGVNKKDIKEITKKYKEVKIRQGIAFSPVFLISFIIFIILVILKMNLWDSFW